MKVKFAFWILSVLLFWMAGPAGRPGALANGPARGTSGCVDNTWTAVAVTAGRDEHTAVWTGTEMIVWGGFYDVLSLNTGGRYDPAIDTWAVTRLDGAPSARRSHTAVWTSQEMIVWGGYDRDGSPFNTGGRYDPETDTWTAVSTDGAPSARAGHTAVWTGTEMLVWGGCVDANCRQRFNSGGRYDPVTDTWAAISTINAPSARGGHTTVWTGTEMLVWGGGYYDGAFYFFSTGGRYDPVTDTWAAISTDGAPSARNQHTAVWTGTEMIVWGGFAPGIYFDSGSRYDPAADTWTAIRTVGAPSARSIHTAVWTGTQMIVWGGWTNNGSWHNTGGRYDPAADLWVATNTAGAPSGRAAHRALWTGTEMLVWGGRGPSLVWPNTGGRYCASGGSDGPPQR